MSPWTRFLDGDNKEDSRQLLPGSDHPEVHRGQDVDHSTQAASSHADAFPDPVKPDLSARCTTRPESGYPAIGMSPPPVYAPGDIATGHPVLRQATEPPPPGHSQLVTNERRIVQQPMHGSAVIVSCPQCGHVGPAIVNKEAGFITYFSSGLLCFLGCCVLSLFPFCCESTKDWVYRCSQCNVLFGRERP